MRPCTLLLLVALSGCKGMAPGTTTSPPPPDQPGPAPAGSAILLSNSRLGIENGVFLTAFNFSALDELWVRVITPQMPKTAMLHLQFVNPKGVLTYTDDAAYTTDPSGGQMMHQQLGDQIPMNPILSIPGGSALDRGLPIGGTSFVRYPEEGDWQVQARLDGVPGMITTPMHVVYTR